MTVELEADGVHFYCSSPEVTRRLVERGARIIGRSRAEDRRLAVRLPEGGRWAPSRRSAGLSDLRRDDHARRTERRAVVVGGRQEPGKQLANDALDIVLLAAVLLAVALVTVL